MSEETIGTCAHCSGSVRAWTGPHGQKHQAPAVCVGCGRTWPRLKEWGGAPVALPAPSLAADSALALTGQLILEGI